LEENIKKKVAFVLEGGAMRGLYSAGVLDVFMQNGINTDAIYGVSAGALFGINFKSKQIGRALRYNLKYAKNKNYMGLYSLITTGDIMNKEFCFNDLVYKLDRFDFDTFNSSPINFYAVVTNVKTGKAEYIKISDARKDLEYLRASGSMPFVSRFVEIGDNKYLDGAISDAIPLEKVIEEGYEKIIVVLTRTSDYRKHKTFLPYSLFYGSYPEFVKTGVNQHVRYNATIDMIEKYNKDNKIIVLRPSKKVKINRVEKDIRKIQAIYDLGVSDAKNDLEKIKQYLEI